MELHVFEKPAQKKNEIYLKLVHDKVQKEIVVVACDKYGEEYEGGKLVAIGEDGTFVRFMDVNPMLGFELDKHHKIKELPA